MILRILNALQQRIIYNRINFFKTFLINFLYLPFSVAIRFPIIVYGRCKIMLFQNGTIVLNGPIKTGMVKIGYSDPVRSAKALSFLRIEGKLILHENVELRRGIHLQIGRSGVLSLGRSCLIADNNTIICFHSITIHDFTRCGNNTQWMDTDFHYIINTENGLIKNNVAKIEIGENNWIGAWCVIKKGTATPNGTILAGPYSMISKNYTETISPNTLLAGSPCKPILKNLRRVQNPSTENMLNHYFSDGHTQYKLPDDVSLDNFCTK